MSLARFPELQKLTCQEKMKLADELWQAGVSDSMPVTEAQKDVLDARWAAYRAGTMTRISVAELNRRLAKG